MAEQIVITTTVTFEDDPEQPQTFEERDFIILSGAKDAVATLPRLFDAGITVTAEASSSVSGSHNLSPLTE